MVVESCLLTFYLSGTLFLELTYELGFLRTFPIIDSGTSSRGIVVGILVHLLLFEGNII